MDQFDAAFDGDLACVQQLVTEENVDERDGYGKTVLHYACEGGHHHVTGWVMGLGANLNVRDALGRTALYWATYSSQPRCIKLLLDAGADAGIATADDVGIPLHYAWESAECTALLIAAYPAGVNAVDKNGSIPLHRTSEVGTVQVCALLLDAGSKVDVLNKFHHTPLYWALRNGHRDVAALVLDRGAQLEHIKCDMFLKAIPKWALSFVGRRDACRLSCWAMLELARRRSRVIGGNNRDVLGMVARMVWDSRREESWERNQE